MREDLGLKSRWNVIAADCGFGEGTHNECVLLPPPPPLRSFSPSLTLPPMETAPKAEKEIRRLRLHCDRDSLSNESFWKKISGRLLSDQCEG